MALAIGSNLSSLQAQRRLGEASSSLGRSSERLASGQRINRASDDSAGLAIAESLRADRRVFTQAVRNINDGISMFSITEGALGELKGILLRQRELATQASNGTYSLTQRLALDKERKALEDEYNRIIKSTSFNGRKVFDEAGGPLVLQAGYGDECALAASADNTLDFEVPLCASLNGAGGQSEGGDSIIGRRSADGRYVVFQSGATNLVSGDGNGQNDIFLKDLVGGATCRVSTTSTGQQAMGGSSIIPQVTPDGRYVVFESAATNLVSGDSNGQSDIFWKDVLTGELRRVNTDSSGNQAIGGTSDYAEISADGRYVVFKSAATNLVSADGNTESDIFLKDMLTGETRRVNTDSSGNQALGGASQYATITPDGRYVSFRSAATNLVSGDTNNLFDLFVKDLITGTTTRVNTNSAGGQSAGGDVNTAKLSSDGRYVLFSSYGTNLVSGDTNNQNDVFIKDLVTGEARRVSTDGAGNQVLGGWSDAADLSQDGRYVTFASEATNLVSNDNNASADIFLKDLLTGETRRINTDGLGAQASGGHSFRPYISPDGRYVSFDSGATNLVGGDTNTVRDIFLVQNPLAERYSVNLLFGVSLQTESGARYMQTFIDRQLTELSGYEGQLGAIQQRLGVAGGVLSSMNENIASAESRIRDVDVAEESSELARISVVQQAASSILAQANQVPALALNLLA